jgi:hypothetical protein
MKRSSEKEWGQRSWFRVNRAGPPQTAARSNCNCRFSAPRSDNTLITCIIITFATVNYIFQLLLNLEMFYSSNGTTNLWSIFGGNVRMQ